MTKNYILTAIRFIITLMTSGVLVIMVTCQNVYGMTYLLILLLLVLLEELLAMKEREKNNDSYKK